MVIKKRAQVWVETVTYTLIAFVLIGLVLAVAKPKIEEHQHKSILEQSSQMLKEIDQVIQEVGQDVPGNKREVELTLKQGSLKISPTTDMLIFEMDSRYIFSEPGEIIEEGSLIIQTREKGKFNEVNMTLNYAGDYDILQNGGDTTDKIISKSSQPYRLFISNNGNGKINIEI